MKTIPDDKFHIKAYIRLYTYARSSIYIKMLAKSCSILTTYPMFKF